MKKSLSINNTNELVPILLKCLFTMEENHSNSYELNINIIGVGVKLTFHTQPMPNRGNVDISMSGIFTPVDVEKINTIIEESMGVSHTLFDSIQYIKYEISTSN